MVSKLMIKQFLGLSPTIKVQAHLQTEHHGTEYGGWTIKKNSIQKTDRVISAGIGNDISFDLSIIGKYDPAIIAIDPTPQVSTWLAEQTLPSNFNYLPVGLAANDGTTKFFTPAKVGHVSHSQQPASASDNNFITVPVLSLTSLLAKYGWDNLDLLKMDIEGFEYEVIEQIVHKEIKIGQLLVEFHHGMYGYSNSQTLNAIALLNKAGYQIFSVAPTGREVSFILD